MHARSRAASSLAPALASCWRASPPSASLRWPAAFVSPLSDLQPVRQRGGRLVSHRAARPAHRLAATSVVRGQHCAGAAARPPCWLRSAATCRPAFRCSNVWAQSRRNTLHRRRQVRIDGVPAAAALPADRLGRPLPSFAALRRLEPGELFLLSVTNPASFDSRYFGPVSASAVIGIAHRSGWRHAHDGRRFAARCRASHRAIEHVQWLLPCRRACSAGAFAPRLAQHPAQPSSVQRLASNAPGLRPLARSPARWLQAAQRRRAADARSDSEGQRRKARFGTLPPAKPVCTWGGARRLRRRAWGEARADACPRASHARTRRSLHTAMTDRGDHDFWCAWRRRTEAKGPELRFQGAQAGWQGQRRQVGGAPSYRWRERPARRPAARLTA